MKSSSWPVGHVCSALCIALSVMTLSATIDAKKRRKRSVATFSADWANAPSVRYASLSPAECKAELRRRKVRFTSVTQARGVRVPVRILDGVGGVVYRTLLPRTRRKTNVHEIFDCRLVVALDDFSRILKKHGVDDVVIFSAWRPPSKRWPADREARRHPGALAVDIMRIRQTVTKVAPTGRNEEDAPEDAATHRWLDVTKDFGGQIGALSCGHRAPKPTPNTAKARAMRAIYCETAQARIFTSMLSPNYDRAHHNHWHLELAPKVKWRIVR